MQDCENTEIGAPLFQSEDDRNIQESWIIGKGIYEEQTQKLWVSSALYFTNVSAQVWGYKIGGYQVLDKYLKSHKGEKIDHKHFQKIIQTLHKSLEIESQIAMIKI